MRRTRIAVVALLMAAAGCRKTPPPAPPPVPAPAPAPAPAPQVKRNVVVLLPDDGGSVGRIVVTNAAGRQELTEAYAAVAMAGSAAPVGFKMTESEVRQQFGAVLDSLPAPERVFALYFETAREVLTAESTRAIPEVARAIQERRSTDVSIIGHTDTTGDATSNFALGMRRAQRVAEILRSSGIDASILTVASHGEANPVVRTADNVSEPKNRRVEVIVR